MPNLFRGSSELDGLPLTTRSGIYYEIDSLNYREQWIPGANQTTVVVRVPSDQSWDFVTDMVGKSYGGSTMRRDAPEANPFDPKQFCMKVEQVDQGGDPDYDFDNYHQGTNTATNEGPRYDPSNGWPLTLWTRYKLTFQGPDYYIRSDDEVDTLYDGGTYEKELFRYVVRKQRSVVREQQIPGGAFKLVDDVTPANRLPLQQTAFKIRPQADVQYVWHRVPVSHLPLTNMKALQGKVNSTAFDAYTPDGGYNFAAGTLLYAGFDDSNRYFDANEDWVCDVIFYFRYIGGLDSGGTERGWNYFLNANADLIPVSLDGTSSGTKPYATADLHPLFRTV